MRPRIVRPLVAAVVLALVAAPVGLTAQSDAYHQPPAPIARILDAAPTPLVVPSPDRARLLLLERPALPAISEVAAPRLRLAGDRIDPRLNIGSNEPTFTALRVRDVAG
ncbi:MAG TPA: hypothetical protein VNA89_14395, partial [Gemmatimonadaceae bacterium]|nr:hypothetical protein [Gemmatimonadaceae bacterium]